MQDQLLYTLETLESLPTLAQGQTCNLKIDKEEYRVWLSRCTVADGEPFNNKVTVEHLKDGQWVDHCIYPAGR
jgi:hypothetical protein